MEGTKVQMGGYQIFGMGEDRFPWGGGGSDPTSLSCLTALPHKQQPFVDTIIYNIPHSFILLYVYTCYDMSLSVMWSHNRSLLVLHCRGDIIVKITDCYQIS